MSEGVQAVVPGHTGDKSCCLILESNAERLLGRELGPQETFEWHGVDWTSTILLTRLIYVGAALGIVLLAARLFDRFDSARAPFGRFAPAAERIQRTLVGLSHRLSRRGQVPSDDADEPMMLPHERVTLTPLDSRPTGFRFAGLLVAELRLMLKGLQWWWYLVAVGLIVASLAMPFESVQRWLLPAVWLWPVLIWSSMGVREVQNRTDQLVFSAPHPLVRQLPVTWLSGLVLTAVIGSGVLLRLLIDGDADGLITWTVGALFIPSLALALGPGAAAARCSR